jgi:hypothetical protein
VTAQQETHTTPQAKRTPTCPPWCVAAHQHDTDHLRIHRGRELNPTFGVYGQLRWDEAIGGTDNGARVWLDARGDEVPLEPWQAGRLADVLDVLGAQEAAGLLRDVLQQAEPQGEPVYLEVGSEIPDQPGYVVGSCGHRVAVSEWRAGFRTCERCPSGDPQDGGAR